jgi:hypothetical protein
LASEELKRIAPQPFCATRFFSKRFRFEQVRREAHRVVGEPVISNSNPAVLEQEPIGAVAAVLVEGVAFHDHPVREHEGHSGHVSGEGVPEDANLLAVHGVESEAVEIPGQVARDVRGLREGEIDPVPVSGHPIPFENRVAGVPHMERVAVVFLGDPALAPGERTVADHRAERVAHVDAVIRVANGELLQPHVVGGVDEDAGVVDQEVPSAPFHGEAPKHGSRALDHQHRPSPLRRENGLGSPQHHQGAVEDEVPRWTIGGNPQGVPGEAASTQD